MKISNFILLVNIYGFFLAGSMLLLPSNTVEYFGGNPENLQETGLMQYLGVAHLAFNTFGFLIRKTLEKNTLKAFLTGVMIATFGGLAVSFYNVFAKNLPIHSSAIIDWSIWAILGIGSIYFFLNLSKKTAK
ncbi:hypothetical protein EGI22_14930 [Lacihabitans sp. LS3-19]|uniref:hypothetical protein n=1 Tax=Lacihabitans sp. LS3-19 TaxID=2487335 RepID=UPI0020CBE3EE|nr:hypothetical protein [Lacihabitans sp. LS3-19]MCP9769210.1 hypothetical protein [Lacihabitans sp. LS3-19]